MAGLRGGSGMQPRRAAYSRLIAACVDSESTGGTTSVGTEAALHLARGHRGA